MGWIENIFTEYFDNNEVIVSEDSLGVFTNYQNEGDRKCVWSYKFYGVTSGDTFVVFKEESDYETLCGCQECKDFGEDLFEYFAVYKTLSSLKKTFSEQSYSLWVNSERLMDEAGVNAFEYYDEIYRCDFLKRIGKEFSKLLTGVSFIKYNNEPTSEGAPF